ncbi:MAG: sigma-70 family RNA polymerase sigma factor [Candidatus Poribacteria bacterium]|nr:sigma-70 family RNA polymerase sigma factor [Candidatus Poribacteria bacterium]
MRNDFLAFSNLTDEELIQRVQDRNEAAFAELISRWTPRIRGIIISNSRQRRDAEEIHTDIWVAVWQNIRDLRNVDSFGAWLHRIAYNACKRYYTLAKQSRSEVPHEQSVLVENIDQHAAARYQEAQLIADVKEVVHHLPQKVRSVAELFYLESWSIKEISEEFNLAVGTVKTKLREIRTLLREEFDVEPIRGEVMTLKNVESHNPIQIETNKTEPSRKPAVFNVVTNDPTGQTWALPEGAIVRFGKGNVEDAKLSPDGTYFAVGTGMGLWWYDVSSMLPISLWETERGLISSFDFSHDGKWIVIYNSDGIIKVLDVQSGSLVVQIEDQYADRDLTCSSNGKWIAIAGGDGVVKVLDVQSGMCIAQMDRGKHEWKANDISQLEFSPDGELLAAVAGNPKLYLENEDNYDDELLNPGTEGDQIYVWHPETGEVILKFAGRNFTFSSDSRLLAGACPDETLNEGKRVDRWVSVWDVTSAEHIAQFTEHDDWVDNVAFSPCGQFVASSDAVLRVWDIATGSEKKVYPNFSNPFYTKDGRLYALGFVNFSNPIEVWDMENREKLFEMTIGMGLFDLARSIAIAYTQQLANTPSNKRTEAKNPVFSIVREHRFPWPDPKGIWVDNQTLVSKTHGEGILLWDIAKKRMGDYLLKNEWIGSYTVLPDGRILASCITKESKVWDAKKPDNPIAKFTITEGPFQWARDAVFAPTGDRIAVGSRLGTLYVWNFQQPERTIALTGHTDHIWTLAFSPDGKTLASSAADETTRVWDLELGEEIAILPIGEQRISWGLVFSPCGRFIVGGMDNEIRFWCAEKLTLLRSIPQPESNRRTYALAFSPCGKYLASGTWWQQGMEKMAIRLWDVATDENIHTFWGHNSDVQSLSFSPDGTHLASSGFDYTILVWNLKPYL